MSDLKLRREQKHDLVWLDRAVFFDRAAMRRGPVILDVGAVTLDLVRRYQALLPGCGIVTYEARQAAYDELTRAPLPRSVRVHRAALAPVSGVLDFYVFEHAAMSALEPWHECGPARLDRVERVDGLTLRQMIVENGLGIIDLLTLNCEGAELWALKELCTRPELRAQIRQVLVSFHCSDGHLLAYPPEVRDGLLAALAQHYVIIPGLRHTQWFLLVRQELL